MYIEYISKMKQQKRYISSTLDLNFIYDRKNWKKFFLVYFKLSIYGVILSLIVFSIMLFVFNQRDLNRIIKYKNTAFSLRFLLTYSLMFISSGIMGFITFISYNFLNTTFLGADKLIYYIIKLLICMIIAIIIYSVLIIFLGVVRKRDAEYIPFISKVSFLLRG